MNSIFFDPSIQNKREIVKQPKAQKEIKDRKEPEFTRNFNQVKRFYFINFNKENGMLQIASQLEGNNGLISWYTITPDGDTYKQSTHTIPKKTTFPLKNIYNEFLKLINNGEKQLTQEEIKDMSKRLDKIAYNYGTINLKN